MHWFIDDERFPAKSGFQIFRGFSHIDFYLEELNFRKITSKVQYISFDHDLGENEPTGYDILKMLIHNYPELLSDNLHIYVHSQNPIGKENILAYAENYKRVFGSNWRIER